MPTWEAPRMGEWAPGEQAAWRRELRGETAAVIDRVLAGSNEDRRAYLQGSSPNNIVSDLRVWEEETKRGEDVSPERDRQLQALLDDIEWVAENSGEGDWRADQWRLHGKEAGKEVGTFLHGNKWFTTDRMDSQSDVDAIRSWLEPLAAQMNCGAPLPADEAVTMEPGKARVHYTNEAGEAQRITFGWDTNSDLTEKLGSIRQDMDRMTPSNKLEWTDPSAFFWESDPEAAMAEYRRTHQSMDQALRAFSEEMASADGPRSVPFSEPAPTNTPPAPASTASMPYPDTQTILECLNDCAEEMTRGRYDHNVTIDRPGHATIDATVGSRWGDSPVHIEVEWPTDPNADLRDKMGAVLEGLGNAYYHEMDDNNRGDVLLALENTRDAIRDGDYVSRTFEEDWEDDYEPENEDPNSEEEDWEEDEDDWGDEDEDDWGDDDDDGFEDDFEPEPAASEKRGFFSRAADALSGLGQLKPEPAKNPFGGDPSVGCGNNSIGTGGMVRAHQMHYRDKDGNIRVTERKEHFRNAPMGKR